MKGIIRKRVQMSQRGILNNKILGIKSGDSLEW